MKYILILIYTLTLTGCIDRLENYRLEKCVESCGGLEEVDYISHNAYRSSFACMCDDGTKGNLEK